MLLGLGLRAAADGEGARGQLLAGGENRDELRPPRAVHEPERVALAHGHDPALVERAPALVRAPVRPCPEQVVAATAPLAEGALRGRERSLRPVQHAPAGAALVEHAPPVVA